jgi:uncharacterized protein YndB with AHSA1/START domain
MRIRRSIVIEASADRIWAMLVDPAEILKWCAFVRTIRQTGEQRGGRGTAFYFEEDAGGRLLKLHLVVTEWEPNIRLAFRMTAGNFVKSYEQRYTIDPVHSGSLVTILEDVRLPYGVFGRIAGVFRRPVSEARLEDMLARMKSLSEDYGNHFGARPERQRDVTGMSQKR